MDKLDLLLEYMNEFTFWRLQNIDFGIAIKTIENKDYWLNGYDGSIQNRKRGIVHKKDYLSDRVYLCFNKHPRKLKTFDNWYADFILTGSKNILISDFI